MTITMPITIMQDVDMNSQSEGSPKWRREALVIVHLSSLDAFTDEYGFANGAYFASQLFAAIGEHAGLVVVLDQGWPFHGEESDPRQLVLRALKEHPQVVWFPHTENTPVDLDPWEHPMEQLGALLRGHGITQVVLGGCFATSDDSGGCVNKARRSLEEQGFVSRIDDGLCGFEEDSDEQEGVEVEKHD